MRIRKTIVLALAGTLAFGSAGPTMAGNSGGSAFVGGLFGSMIGAAIVNDANRKQSAARASSAVVAERREIQTALNYFDFPVGAVDGVLGRRSRAAIAEYQTMLGFQPTGELTAYQKDFLLNSYHRAIAGGMTTTQLIAANPMGPRGLLLQYRDELAAAARPAVPTTTAPVAETVTASAETQPAQPNTALPNFLGAAQSVSLASHCNKVSLLTNTNGGFVTVASMSDPNMALNEQFCLARTYAIAAGEEMAKAVPGVTPDQIAQQCQAFGPAMQPYVASLSLKPRDAVLQDVGGFILKTGMSPAQLNDTAKICLSVGYRTDNMGVAIGSALLLTALGNKPYAELMGHHLSQGIGASKRPDLALEWYQMSVSALHDGANAVFVPGQPERTSLIEKAALMINGTGQADSPAPEAQPAALPNLSVSQ